jgi:cytochrome c oxidase subunit 2
MRRHITIAVAIWVVATALIVVGAAVINPFPTQGSRESHTIDHAFRVMSLLAAPVLAMVIAVVGYSLLRFRGHGPDETGEPIRGTGMIPKAWFAITTALCVVVIIFPGLTGLAELRADRTPDLKVNVTAARWTWSIDYPDSGVKVHGSQEMVLPVNRRVEFDITSVDVLHSFWVPAFRLRMDAVPGQTTKLFITPTEIGSEQTDAAFRLQCSQLCGLQHANMTMPVRVVSQADYDAWVQSNAPVATATPQPGATPAGVVEQVELSEFKVALAPTVAAGTVSFEVKNAGAVPHEFVVIQTDLAPDALPQVNAAVDESKVTIVGRTDLLNAGDTATLTVTLPPGKYVVICNVPGHYALGMRAALTVQ